MNTNNERKHVIDTLFVIALFALFAFSAILLIAIGASIYRRSVDTMESNYRQRTSFAYVTEKLRRADTEAQISVGTPDGRTDFPESLLLREVIDDISYTTYLYPYEGYLCELMVKSDQSMSPSAGQQIMPIGDMKAEALPDGLIRVVLTGEMGEERTLLFAVRSEDDTMNNREDD